MRRHAPLLLATLAMACEVSFRPVDKPDDTDGTDATAIDTDTTTTDTDATDTTAVDTDATDATAVDTDATDVDTDATSVDTDPTDSTDPTDPPVTTTPGPGDLVIVEIQGNPQSGPTDSQGEYIEVLNVSGHALTLHGITLAHVVYPATGSAPVVSTGQSTVSTALTLADGERALFTRSNGGYFGTAPLKVVYDDFVFSNSSNNANRIRLMVPGWNGTEPPAPADLIDEVTAPAAQFDNDVRGRAWQLKPSVTATAASNDVVANWCVTDEGASLAYFTSNWGTPGAVNVCN